jgi:hypothetical protein
MTSEDRMAGAGPDDMGDDEQEFEVAEYDQYIEDPPDSGLAIDEDDDADGERDVDWAETHPRQVLKDNAEPDDRPAESSAVHEIPGT